MVTIKINTDMTHLAPCEAVKLSHSEKSAGKKRLRIHFRALNHDLFGIRVHSTALSHIPSKLNFFERRRMVLLKVSDGTQEGYIKVNSESLRKRLGISKKEFNQEKKKGRDLTDYIEKKIGSFMTEKSITLKNGVIYKGQVKNNLPHGKGILQLPDGGVYDGLFSEGSCRGEGTYTGTLDGKAIQLQGYFNQNYFYGKVKRNRYAQDQHTYNGMLKDFKFEGKGYFTTDKFWANGILHWANGSIYDEYDGHGTLKRTNGEFYKGSFKKGNYEGYGVSKSADGDVYKGNFKNGEYDGHGTLKHPSGDFYKGSFKEGEFDGYGVRKFADGGFEKGFYKKGLFEGKGIRKYDDGDMYRGSFFQDDFEGPGVIKFADGRVFKGNFKRGRIDGKGVLIYSDGSKKERIWNMADPWGIL